jgi:hypothetical protein
MHTKLRMGRNILLEVCDAGNEQFRYFSRPAVKEGETGISDSKCQ